MDTSEIISKPTDFYNNPEELIKSYRLNDEQKLNALKNWKQFCEQLQVSTDEGMDGDNRSMLQAVSEALSKLERKCLKNENVK